LSIRLKSNKAERNFVVCVKVICEDKNLFLYYNFGIDADDLL